MINDLTKQQFFAMIIAGQEEIASNHELLTKLDSAIGDGDHGTTMLRTTKAVIDAIGQNETKTLKEILSAISWAIMEADGGSVGPLMGSMFLGFASGTEADITVTKAQFATMFIAGIEKMHSLSKANVGDKTMMDALLPAKDCLQADCDDLDLVKLLTKVASSAKEGSQATSDMLAKFGRARNLGDKVIGHQDPGSVTVSLMFAGFSNYVNGI